MSSTQDLLIVPFEPQYAADFDRINREWISDMFKVEGLDDLMLRDPQSYIIDKGGYIWFIMPEGERPLGTCALIKKGEGVFELTKMGVLSRARGLGVGEVLLKHVIQEAVALEMGCLYLLTNSKCEAAIHLYERNGFVHDEEIMAQYGALYERCNVAMRHRS